MKINTITLGGRLGLKPELKTSSNERPMTSLFLIVDDSYSNKETGEKTDRSIAVPVYVYGRQAEVCVKYLEKGQFVYIQGSLSQYKKTDESGQERTHTNYIAKIVEFGQRSAASVAANPAKTEQRPF